MTTNSEIRVRGIHGGVPSFFRASCYTAAGGGSDSYANAGWNLANSLGTQVPDDIELDEWVDEVDVLCQLAADDDRQAIRRWFEQHFPRAMAIVPPRRRDQFVAGVIRAWDDGRIGL
jgi:hypothetical protein